MAEKMIDAILRAICGAVLILFINMLLAPRGISTGVGVNPLTVLITGTLGLPGLAVLFCLGFYKQL